jgi:NADH-quinone oxidoreductase subunit G
MGNLLDIEEFDYDCSEAVRDELLGLEGSFSGYTDADLESTTALKIKPADLDVPIYSIDALTRRAISLQQTVDAEIDWRKSA